MKESLKDQKIASRVLITPEDYYDRHYHQEADRPLSAIVLFTAGCVLGLMIMFAAHSCERKPMPAVVTHSMNGIRCTVCHYDRIPALNTSKKYRTFHQRKSAPVALDNAKELEYLASLIAGGKP